MRRFSFVSLICLAFFSFLSCVAEVSSYSSVSVTVIPPQDNSEHGYIQSDLESCKLELFTSSNGKSALYAVDFNKPLYLSDLNSGSLTVRAYGYDSSATAIALSEIEVFNLDDDASLSKNLTLSWYEKGKGTDEYCYVKFDTDGGSGVAQQKVKSGSQVTLPPLFPAGTGILQEPLNLTFLRQSAGILLCMQNGKPHQAIIPAKVISLQIRTILRKQIIRQTRQLQTTLERAIRQTHRILIILQTMTIRIIQIPLQIPQIPLKNLKNISLSNTIRIQVQTIIPAFPFR